MLLGFKCSQNQLDVAADFSRGVAWLVDAGLVVLGCRCCCKLGTEGF
jgi:hypothetical protein